VSVKFTKDANGNMVGKNQITNVLNQAELDAQAQYAAAARIDPYTAQKIKDNAAAGTPMSAGVLGAISAVGISVNSAIGNNIATIDSITRESRLGDNMNTKSQQTADESNIFWRTVKAGVRGASTVWGGIYQGLNAQYRAGTQMVSQAAQNFALGVAGKGLPVQPQVSTDIPSVPSQTVAGQIIIDAIKDVKSGKIPSVDLGTGFFPSESTGAGKAAREASLASAKIAVRDSSGKIIGYQPRTILGDAYSNIFTLGNPESSQGAVISAVADIVGSFAFDTGIARAAELKRLAKLASQARAEGAMDVVAKIEDRVTKIKEAEQIATTAKNAAIKQVDEVSELEIKKALLDATESRAAWDGKNKLAIDGSIGVRTATNRLNQITAIAEEQKAQLATLTNRLNDLTTATNAPVQIAKLETTIAKKTNDLENLKKSVDEVIASGRVPSRTADDFAKDQAEIDALIAQVDNLRMLSESNPNANIEKIQEIKDAIAQTKKFYNEARTAVTGAKTQVAKRTRDAKIASRAREIAATDYAKNASKSRKMSEILADKNLSKDEKLTAWANSLEVLAGIKQASGLPEFSYNKVADFLTAGYGTKGLDRLAEITDWKEIWRASNGKIDSTLARKLADAKTQDEVLEAIAPFIKRGDINAGDLRPGIIERSGANFSEKATAIKDKAQFLLPAAKVLTGVGARVQYRLKDHAKVAALFDTFQTGTNKTKKFLSKEYNTIIKSGSLVNIHDTETLLQTVDNFGRAVNLETKVLNDLIEEIATAPSSAIRGYAASVKLMKAVFAQYEEKVPVRMKDSFKRATTAFESSNEEMSSYWATRHINGAKLQYVDLAGNKVVLPGPHLDSELLNSTVYLPSPAEYIKLVSKLAKLPAGGKSVEVADTLISNWWKKMQLVRPAFVIRNIAEEQLRVFGTGHISLLNNPAMAISMWMGREEGPAWRRLLFQFDEHRNNLMGDTFSTGDDITDVVQETVAHQNKNSFVDIMSADAKGSFDDRAVKVLSFKNVGAVGYGHKRFFDGIANQLRILNGSELARVVAGATPKGVDDAIKAGASREDAVIDYFFSGAGRKTLEDFAASTSDDFKNFIFTRDGLKKYLYTAKDSSNKDISILARVLEVTGGNANLREIVAYGTTKLSDIKYRIPRAETEAINSISNAKQISNGKKALLDAQAQFAKQINEAFSTVGNWDNVLMNVPSKNLAYLEGTANDKGIVTRFIDGFFDISTQLEKNSTFGPEFRQAYWDAIKDISKALDSNAKTQLEKVAQDSLKPILFRGSNVGEKHPVWSAFRSATGDGPLTIADAHAYADNVARKHVKELFYNASNRRLMFHQLRLIGPFMNAWENTLKSWSMIGIENPIQVYKGIKTLEWLQSPESSSIYQLTDARDFYDPNQGFFFTDPETEQEMFWVPFTGTVLSKLAGGLTGNNYKGAPIAFSSNPMSFNFALGAGSILPGVGPGVTIPISALGTWNQGFIDNMPEGIKNWLFPFGTSDFTRGPLGAVLPANWNRILGGALGFKETYASAYKPVLAYLSAGANYNLDNPDDQVRLAADADIFARWFGVMRGITGLVAPSSLQIKGLATDGTGDALTQMALYKDFQDILVANDGNWNKSVGEFLDLFGAPAIFAITGTSAGDAPSNLDSYKFITKYPDVVSKYGDIYGFVFPGGGLSQEMYKWNLISGKKTKLNPTQIIEKANNYRYYAAHDMLLAQVDAGLMDKNQLKDATELLKLSMNGGPKASSDYNRFDRVIFQLKNLAKDERFFDVPSVKALRDYMYLRDIALANLGKISTDKLTGSKPEVVQQRAWLSEQAIWILKDNQDFQKIFYRFFANELEGN
jgi:hypothetical protein